MKFSRFNRVVHRWGSILVALPLGVIIVTGLILQLKKQSAWVQPKTQTGSSEQLRLSFREILDATKGVPEAEVRDWADIDRLDVRPSKGIVKVRCRNRWEVQLDTNSGEVLQVAYRRSDLIESLHDGSYFHDYAKLGLFLPTAIVLAVLWITGIYLFFLPQLARRHRVRQKARNELKPQKYDTSH